MSEVVSAFGFGEQGEYAAAELPELFGSPLGTVAEQLLELTEGEFDWIEIGRIGRQVTDLGTGGLNGCHDARRLVAGEVVHYHDVARAKRGDELLLDPGPEHTAIDRAFHAQRCDEAGGT